MKSAKIQTRPADTRPQSDKRSLRIVVVISFALSSFLVLASCGGSAADRASEVGGVTAGQIIENPAAYVGKTVTVSGHVGEIYGPSAFNMDSGLSAGELLVIGREPFPQVPDVDNRVYVVSDIATVTGTVRLFVTAEIEREIGWDLDPRIEAEFNSKPVLIAQSLSFRPDADRTAKNDNSGQTSTNTHTNSTTSANKVTDTSTYASTEDKLSLVGREVQLTNARVVRVVGPRTFTIASGDSEIYVVLSDESDRGVGTQGKIRPGSTVNITGGFERLEAAQIETLSDNRFRTLTDTERTFLKNTSVFIQADEVSDTE